MPNPSTRTLPDGTFPTICAFFLDTSNTLPISKINIFDLFIPIFSAILEWLNKCIYSPCTGTKNLGFNNAWISLSSCSQAWPETCISSIASYITSAPFSVKSSITLDTAFLFPGIGVDDIITISPFSIWILLWFPEAILVSAAIGSPWLPVVIIVILLLGYFFMSFKSITISSGINKYPNDIATSDILSILLPLKAIFLPYFIEAFAICCTLWTLEAKVATITLPSAFVKRLSKASPTVFSDIV